MPQSLACIPIHFIWSTRDRRPFIKPEIEKELFSQKYNIEYDERYVWD